jgi:4-hydroxymandelate oxidase
MNRRKFGKSLAVGAGALGLRYAKAEANENPPEAPGNPAKSPATPSIVAAPVSANDFRELARAKLPKATFEYITSGSGDEITLRENISALERIKILPPLLTGVAKADLSTTVLKQPIAMPIMLAPVAAQRMYHPQGALAAARAAAALGTLFGVSSSATNSVEEIAAASEGPKWFQLYLPKDRAVAGRLIERVNRSGYKAIVLTVDLGERKDPDLRHRFALPRDMLLKHLRDIGFDAVSDGMSHAELIAFNTQAWDMAMTWEVFDWLRSVTKLPLLIKGVLRTEDAKRAVALGLDGIVVSNHGGRRLDGMPASIDRLAGIVEAVDGRAEVFMDSGIRRGTDVLKALALGARAVMIGRPYAWALAADGEAGVRKVLELLRDELTNAMLACGCAKIGDISRSLVM